MRRGAGLHADEARRQRFEERQHLAAPELLPNDDLLAGVDPVDLEHVLGDIQTDRGNLHVKGSPHVIRLRRITLWHSMPGAGPVHHIRSGLSDGGSQLCFAVQRTRSGAQGFDSYPTVLTTKTEVIRRLIKACSD
jgi:hypothetical protein